MWHNLLTCKTIYDRDGRLAQAKARFDVPYPPQLKANIIHQNLRLLHGNLPSYDGQILKAVKRQDDVSLCHRTAAFMESYFDIIWALNEKTHPGEKRLATLCLENCQILPAGFQENIQNLYRDLFLYPQRTQSNLTKIVDELTKVL